jgi:alcohol dehydrogenase, propanol-preferring
MGSVGIASGVSKIFVIRPPSPGIRSMAGMPSMRLPAPISSFRFPHLLMIYMPLPFCARASSAFAVFVSEQGERVGLFGFGASAHLAIAVLKAWKCEVYVSTRGVSHRKLATSLGATWVGNETERPPVVLDRAVTFAPSGDVVVAALASLRKGGVVAINAIHLDRIPEFDYDRLLWGERQLRSVTNMSRADARDFLQIAGEIGLRPKVTPFPLDQANEALLAIKNDSIDGAAAIIP